MNNKDEKFKVNFINVTANSINEINFNELKAEIGQGKLDFKEGRFITHEEMLLELKNKGII